MFETFNEKEAIVEISRFLKEELQKSGFKKYLLGVSGGIDSTVSLYLAAGAVGKEQVLPVILPYKNTYPEAVIDAQKAISTLGIASSQVTQIDIGPLCDSFFQLDPTIDSLRRGNIMARVRMTVLFDLAKKNQALVLGTENKSEHLLGYFTRFGDEASDVEPIRELYKTQVRLLAQELNVPKQIYDKAPTAGLWPGQTDEGQFGFSYEQADQVFYLHYEQGLVEADIVKKGFAEELVRNVFARVEANKFKQALPKIAHLKSL